MLPLPTLNVVKQYFVPYKNWGGMTSDKLEPKPFRTHTLIDVLDEYNCTCHWDPKCNDMIIGYHNKVVRLKGLCIWRISEQSNPYDISQCKVGIKWNKYWIGKTKMF